MPPVNILIKPASSLCNMRCKYCFYADVSENRETRSYGMMTLDTLEQLVKRTFAYATGYAGFAFQGGEPTLVGLDFYKKLLELQETYNTKHIRVFNSIQTNGYAIDAEWAEFFAKHQFLVGLSMDGTKEAHDSLRLDASGNGTFDRIRKTAELFAKKGVQFNILCVVNNFVARYPQKVYEQLKKYKYMQFIPCLDAFDQTPTAYSLTPERYATFLRQTFDLYYRDFMSGNYVSVRNFDNYVNILMGRPPESCAMNGCCTCYFVVEGDGSVYPCDFYVLDEWKLGNIFDKTLDEMIRSEPAQEFVEQSKYVSEACKSCRYYRICRGGCRREREPFVDGHPGLNRHCKCYTAFFDNSIPKLMEIARHLTN